MQFKYREYSMRNRKHRCVRWNSLELRIALTVADRPQSDIARRMRVSTPTLSRIFTGQLVPSARQRRQLARILRRQEMDLFADLLNSDDASPTSVSRKTSTKSAIHKTGDMVGKAEAA